MLDPILNEYFEKPRLNDFEQRVQNIMNDFLISPDNLDGQNEILNGPISSTLLISEQNLHFERYGDLSYGFNQKYNPGADFQDFYTFTFGACARRIICIEDTILTSPEDFDEHGSNSIGIINPNIESPALEIVKKYYNHLSSNENFKNLLNEYQNEVLDELNRLGSILHESESKMPSIRSPNIMRWFTFQVAGYAKYDLWRNVRSTLPESLTKPDHRRLERNLKKSLRRNIPLSPPTYVKLMMNFCGWTENELALSKLDLEERMSYFPDFTISSTMTFSPKNNRIIELPSYPQIVGIGRPEGDWECAPYWYELTEDHLRSLSVSKKEVEYARTSWMYLCNKILEELDEDCIFT
jgi:hypothetical protein